MSSFVLLGDDVVKYGIFSLLHSYELRKLLTICKYFQHLLKSVQHKSNHNDIKYWNTNLIKYYGNYGVWRRGWIDLSKGIFEKLSRDDIHMLKYFMLRYNPNNNLSTIPLDINSIYLYCYSSTPKEVNRKINFLSNIIQFDEYKLNHNCIREIYLMNSNVRDDHILILSNALLSRKNKSRIELLILYNNEFITELYMELLFRAIGEKAPFCRNLDISQTRCGDGVCDVIHNFYSKYKHTMLSHINLENVLHIITKKGMSKLETVLNIIPKHIKNDFLIRTKQKCIIP
eukprot:349377_1